MNNKNNFIIAICLSAILFSSCSDFLKQQYYDGFDVKEFFGTVDQLSAAALGIYSGLATGDAYAKNIPNMEATSDLDMIKTGSMNTATGDVAQLANFNIYKENSQIESVWKLLYAAVYQANMVIENAHLISAKNEKEALKIKMYVAESKALRAFLYLELVKRWGDIPMRLKPQTTNDLFSGRTPRKVIYDQMIIDLQEAIPDLPWHSDYWAEKGRMNKGAAMGLLVRVCLFAGGYSLHMDGTMKREDNWQEYYQLGKEVSNELVQSGKHNLNPSYENIFFTICQNKVEPSECMFEIHMAYLANNGKHASNIGSGAVKVHTSRYAWCKYASDEDLRLGVNVSIADPAITSNITPTKWRTEWQTERLNWNMTDVNNVILRYADVLLMRAEILNELSPGNVPDEAVELVNKVRRRGYGFDINIKNDISDVPESSKTDKNTFFAFLRDEYAREFLGEGGRRFHLIRWNLLKATIEDMTAIFKDPIRKSEYFDSTFKYFWPSTTFVSGKHELYPIPMKEMLESKGALGENNPGY